MTKRSKPFFGLLPVLAAVACLGGCADSGIDVDVNIPLLDAAGVNLMGKPKPDPNLPDRAPLVLPPQAGALPTPGQAPQYANASNGRQWPTDPEEVKKRAAADVEAERDRYCAQGDWSSKATIEEFRKNTGQDLRCRPKWVENLIGAKKQ